MNTFKLQISSANLITSWNYTDLIDKDTICTICKNNLSDAPPNYNNKYFDIIVGICGHVYHSICINSGNKICPIDMNNFTVSKVISTDLLDYNKKNAVKTQIEYNTKKKNLINYAINQKAE